MADPKEGPMDPEVPTPWFEDYAEDEEGFDIDEFDLTSSPNDFNIGTIFDFIESGAVTIPAFQRNFIWDQPRASKLIESLILGLPVPQVFLFEKTRNVFQVIDGQQRLMSIYYFMKGRFPLREKRVELRDIFEQKSKIPQRILDDDDYFTDFSLKLPTRFQVTESRFQGLTFATLDQYQNQFRLRPVRVVIIRQNKESLDDSAIYEIFSRLNTGGVNLTPQEIRTCMFQSTFYETLSRLNLEPKWRRLLGKPSPDLHLKDVEILLRAFALLIDGDNYKPSMIRFLNSFSKKSGANTPDKNDYLARLFEAFLARTKTLPEDVFFNPETHRFGIGLFEACFAAGCKSAFASQNTEVAKIDPDRIGRLLRDKEFSAASYGGTTSLINVRKRLALAERLMLA
jgi:hypothetical protein